MLKIARSFEISVLKAIKTSNNKIISWDRLIKRWNLYLGPENQNILQNCLDLVNVLPSFNKIAALLTSILKSTRLFKVLAPRILGADNNKVIKDNANNVIDKID